MLPGSPLPKELVGTWVHQLPHAGSAQPVTETLGFVADSYSLCGVGFGGCGSDGRAVIRGRHLVLYGDAMCSLDDAHLGLAGAGEYAFSVTGGKLTLVAVGSDPCGARASLVQSRVFTRVGSPSTSTP